MDYKNKQHLAPRRLLPAPRREADDGRASSGHAAFPHRGGTRTSTKVACTRCSQKKKKCNGVRPVCSACDQQNLPCGWDVPEGQTRQQALKRKHKDLESGMGDMVELLWHLQNGSESDASTIFERVRRGDDVSTILASFNLLGLKDAASTSNMPQGQPSSTGEQGPQASKGRVAQLPESASTGNPSLLPPPRAQKDDVLPALDCPVGSRVPTNISDLIDILRSQRDVFKKAFSIFLQCTEMIFYVYSQKEVDQLLEKALDDIGNQPLSTICEMCSVAAIGSRFSRSQIPPERGQYFYSIAKHLLDDCVEESPLKAIKVCALLAMCNIINKATAALAYIELGLGIARLQGFFEREPCPGLDPETWREGKAVLCSIVLCRGWLQTTLSYVPRKEDFLTQVTMEDLNLEDDRKTDDNTLYQVQIAKLTLIKASIFRSILDGNFATGRSREIGTSLDLWLQSLPESLQLRDVKDATEGCRSLQSSTSTLYLHSFYQGAAMLVYRWVLSRTLRTLQSSESLPQTLEHEAIPWMDRGITAARQATGIIYTIYTNGAAVRHCWLCIFQSYISCCILLYDAAQNLLACRNDFDFTEAIALASKSLEVLSWSSQLDHTAGRYHDLLKPLFDKIDLGIAQSRAAFPASATKYHIHLTPFPGSSSVHKAAQELQQLLYVPFNNERRARPSEVYQPNLFDTVTNLDEAGLGIHLYWKLEFAGRFGRVGSSSGGASEALQQTMHCFGSFAGGIQPLGWTATTPFTASSLTEIETTNIF